MGFASAVLGGSIGFAAQCFSNYAMKIPLSRSTSYICLSVCLPAHVVVGVVGQPDIAQSRNDVCVVCSFLILLYILQSHGCMFFCSRWVAMPETSTRKLKNGLWNKPMNSVREMVCLRWLVPRAGFDTNQKNKNRV